MRGAALGMLVLFAGCAAFSGRGLPSSTYESTVNEASRLTLDERVGRLERPLVDHQVRFVSRGTSAPEATKVLAKWVGHAFARHRELSRSRHVAGPARCHVGLRLEDDYNPLSAGLTGLVSGLTLWIVPAYARDNLCMTVEVVCDGRAVGHYEYRDHIDTWVQLALIPLSGTHAPQTVTRRVVDTMLAHFLNDLDASRALTRPQQISGQ